jgi:hypothetical protein
MHGHMNVKCFRGLRACVSCSFIYTFTLCQTNFQYTVFTTSSFRPFCVFATSVLRLKTLFYEIGRNDRKFTDSSYAFSSFRSSKALGNFSLRQNMSHLEALHFVVQTQLVYDDINKHSIKYFGNYILWNFLWGRIEIIVTNSDNEN